MVISSACRAQLQPPISCLAVPVRHLYLPWLAPAQLRWSAQRRSLYTSRSSHRCGSTQRCRPSPSQSRQLGDLHGVSATPIDNILSSQNLLAAAKTTTGFAQKHGGWHLEYPGHDFASRYVIPDASEKSSVRYRLEATTLGDADDLLRHLDTSLRVGKLERAQTIIFRLTRHPLADPNAMVSAHTMFFDYSLEAVLRQPKESELAKQVYRDMQTWYENEVVRSAGSRVKFRLTPSLLIPLIRGALHAFAPKDCGPVVRPLISAASNVSEEALEEVLFSEVYSDTEYDLVNDIVAESETDNLSAAADLDANKELADNHMTRPRMSTAKKYIELDSLASVLATPTQGYGLRAVQESLSALHELPALPEDASPAEKLERNLAREKILEESAVEIAIKRWQEEDVQLKKIGINTVMQSKPMGALTWQWYAALLRELEAELKACRALPPSAEDADHVNIDRQHYGMYLELMPLPSIAANTILLICRKLTADGAVQAAEIRLTPLCASLGKLLEEEAQHFASNRRDGKSSGAPTQRARRLRRYKTNDLSAHDKTSTKTWPNMVKLKLAAMVIKKLIEVAKLPVTRRHPRTKELVSQLQPAFFTSKKFRKGRKSGVMVANPAYLAKLQSEPVPSLIAKRMPMIVEPRPWKGFTDGGYNHFPTDVMRTANSADGCKDHFIAAANRGDVDQVFAGLTSLSKVPWRINLDVFNAQLEAWNSGEAIANFAPLNFHHKTPPPPAPSEGIDARRRWLLEVRELENKTAGYRSERCFQNFQMEVARAMVNETMWFPHNIDFRGRAYPIPPYLNHMGADNARGLLVFADGKELGEEGLRWLKIHLANVAGYDKASLQEREDFTMANLESIRDSARDPMGGSRWWLKSEDAWQTLAACCELTNALDCPDPTRFVSHLPIHQDGTCNGLQHYAALGGDRSGAMHVNLEPGDRPADVYSGVANGVAEAVERDAAAGHPVAQALAGHITRKVVKQPVMTNVYGVTQYGARAQVRKQVEALLPDIGRFDEVNHGKMSSYIVVKIFDMLSTMFTGAQAIQRWLEVCADRITTCLLPEQIEQLIAEYDKNPAGRRRSRKQTDGGGAVKASGHTKREYKLKDASDPLFKSTVVWTTPLRLPVVQPYRATSAKQIKTALHTLTIYEPRLWDAVNRRKQLQAFPPNFIHSLDATHMLMSANKCAEIGMTFASVHDSFWTHASDVTTMSEVLRDAFVAMHSEDIIGRLREEFNARYQKCLYLSPLDAPNTAIKKILAWRKDNKHPRQELYELKLEHQRMRLLASADANERIAGAQLVTPGSIAEAEGAVTAAEQAHIPSSFYALHEEVGGSSGSTEDTATEPPTPSVTTKKSTAVKVWLSMQFPPVPKKGDFDVTRLRQSKYFFH